MEREAVNTKEKLPTKSFRFQVVNTYSSLVQSVERLTVNQEVTGSSPVGGAKNPANKEFAGFFYVCRAWHDSNW